MRIIATVTDVCPAPYTCAFARRSASFGTDVLIGARELVSFGFAAAADTACSFSASPARERVAASATFYAYSVRERLESGVAPLTAPLHFRRLGKRRRSASERLAVFRVCFCCARLRCRRRRDAWSFLFGVWAKPARARSACVAGVLSPERPTDGPAQIDTPGRGCDRFACLTQISELPPPSGRGLDADHWPGRVVTGRSSDRTARAQGSVPHSRGQQRAGN